MMKPQLCPAIVEMRREKCRGPTLGLNVGVKNSFSFAADLHSCKDNLCVGVEHLKVRDPHSSKTPCESVKDGLSLVGRASEDLKYVE